MLSALAAELSNQSDLFELFRDAKINLSVLGFGLEIDGVPPITDITVALERMLQKLTENGKHVLITVDEAVSNQHVREFVSQLIVDIKTADVCGSYVDAVLYNRSFKRRRAKIWTMAMC